jgi:NTP pyrophosphatase (non-canonical NTP hydrolase)
MAYLKGAIESVQRSVRKGDKKQLERSLAGAVAWFFCVVEHYEELPLARAMASKYSLRHCTYCRRMPCACKSRRQAIKEVKPNRRQLKWGLAQWCHHLDTVYGMANRRDGLDRAINRLGEEMTEVDRAIVGRFNLRSTPDQIQWYLARELADVLAWIIAVANICQVNLEVVTWRVYRKGCPVCRKSPCACPPVLSVGRELRRIGSI